MTDGKYVHPGYNPDGKIIRYAVDEPVVGARFEMWSSGRDDGLSTILEVRPYTGAYPQWFKYIVKFTAQNNHSGTAEVSWRHPVAPE